MEIEQLYPYLVTAEYAGRGRTEDVTLQPLGHGVFSALVFEFHGGVRNATLHDLGALDLTLHAARERALGNLEQLAKRQEIGMQLLAGPENRSFILVGGHWAAATAL